MNGWEPTTGDCWGGRPVARRIADARARRRVVVTGKVVDARPCIWRGSAAHAFALDDGTGRLTIVFGGVRPVPGMVEGSAVHGGGHRARRRAGDRAVEPLLPLRALSHSVTAAVVGYRVLSPAARSTPPAQRVHVPNTSSECQTSVKPCASPTLTAQRSIGADSTSTAVPQETHTRW